MPYIRIKVNTYLHVKKECSFNNLHSLITFYLVGLFSTFFSTQVKGHVPLITFRASTLLCLLLEELFTRLIHTISLLTTLDNHSSTPTPLFYSKVKYKSNLFYYKKLQTNPLSIGHHQQRTDSHRYYR
jgi:hypothetical protein